MPLFKSGTQMLKALACIDSSDLSQIYQIGRLKELYDFEQHQRPEEIFDVLWDRGSAFDTIVIDNAIVDIQDLLVACRNWPKIDFVLSRCELTAAHLRVDNIFKVEQIESLGDLLLSRGESQTLRHEGAS